jgi:methyl-accepting chemotaxis protein WspA
VTGVSLVLTRLRNLSLSAKLLSLVGTFLAIFLAFAVLVYRTIDREKVNGPIYREIVQGKDLVADVLPPPEYIIEAYLLVLQMVDETDQPSVSRLVEKSKQLRADYDERHAVWVAELAPGQIRSEMVERSYTPALEFFRLRDEQFIPAILAGNRDRARELARGDMKKQYELHRDAIDKVVSLTNAHNALTEKNAAVSITESGTALGILGLAVVAVVLLMGWVAYRVGGTLAQRIKLATRAAEQVASGDLTVAMKTADGGDETGQLLRAIDQMSANLHSLVARVKKSSIDLMSTATQLTATSKQQEGTVSGFGAATTEIAAAVKEISATSQELLSTMNGVNSVASQTAALAEGGRASLEGMDATMRQLAQATASISSKLSAIREKAADINVVVTTITKVADQTNLLSVNAAIEAEKAGEYGLGFLVLAREIRRLADQTAVATLDIEQIVRQMQGAVSAGVMEMDKFTEEVRQGVGSVGRISTQLGQIIAQVQGLSDRFDQVNEGMRSQSTGARQINDAMISLADGARQTTGSLREFNSATDHLRDAVSELKQEISHFKMSG